MTSSLVGSEMCIRDRIKSGGTATDMIRGLREAAQHHGRLGAQHPSGPVSYTHLTLPTICSV
eukprot:536897-Prorocentrum_lima.AAC.1